MYLDLTGRDWLILAAAVSATISIVVAVIIFGIKDSGQGDKEENA